MPADPFLPLENPAIPGCRRVEAPLGETWLEVSGPEGRCLVVLPAERFNREGRRGPWPEGSRIRSYFLASSGRRVTKAQWDWTDSQLVREREGGPEPGIRIMPDYGGAYAWDQYGRCAELTDLLGENPEVAALDAACRAWQATWEALYPLAMDEDPSLAPSGGWGAWEEAGLLLCRRLLALLGPEGVVIYGCPPERLNCGRRYLVLYWEGQVDAK